jgi:hypothetical protein
MPPTASPRLSDRLAVCAAAALCLLPAAQAQVAGFAEIRSPAPGEAIAGLVTIHGTAAHPFFAGYDLSFAYSGDPTGTWFPLADRSPLPVSDGRLGLWDTAVISDGEYDLRLRVWLDDGLALEAVVAGLRVRNLRPAETSTPGPGPAPEPTATAEPPTPSDSPTPTPPPAPARRDAVSAAWSAGVLSALAGLGLLGAYTVLRRPLRRAWAERRSPPDTRRRAQRRRRP